MVSVLAVVLMWVLACMGLECWLDGLWGVHGAGMLAGGECIVRSSSRRETTKLRDFTLEYWYLDDACSRVIRIYL